MAEKTLNTRIVLKHGTTAEWAASTLQLKLGEVGVDTTLGIFKIGDGTKTWSEIVPYYATMADVIKEIDKKVANLHATQIFEATVANGGDHAAAIATAVGETALGKGDIAIVKEAIAGTAYEYTAYVYDGAAWKAMDRNYNAENVYFDKDLITTSAIGNITLTNGQATIAATGKNLKQVFDTIFVKESNPTVTQPSVSISLTGAGAKEVGTSVTPSYSVTFNKGKYSYGPDTGITATYEVTDTNGGSATGATGSFDAFTVAEDTNYHVSVTATYGAGATPVTNVGNPKVDLAIAAGTKSANSSSITGYRGWFQGYYNGTNALADPTAITSAQLRAFGVRNGSFSTPMNTTQMKQMFFAAPAGVVKSIGVANAVNGAPQTVLKTTVSINGANNYATADYDLFYVSNAVAEGGDSKWNITVTK